MTRQQSLRQRIRALIDENEPRIMAAFLEGVRDLTDNIQIGIFVSYLERGDVDGAFRALNLDATAFRALDSAVASAYSAGGAATVATMPPMYGPDGGRIIVRLNTRNPRAEREIAEYGARLVTAISRDTEAGLRRVIMQGLADGQNPRQTARTIAGAVNRATGRREGGLIGLTAQQMEYVMTARSELLSGDLAAMRNYLTRGRRDRRFDRTILKAIREERALDRATVDKIVGRYSDGLLKLRADTIARTETLSALNRGQREAWEQAAEAGGVTRAEMRQVWLSAKDARVRDSHREMDGEEIEMAGVFSNGLRYPGDTNGPPSETVNCRCTLFIRLKRRDE